MPVKKYKPNTPGTRGMSVSDFAEITRTSPEKTLTKGKKSTGGRNNYGRITTRFRGGGVKRRYRRIDFDRSKENVPAIVKSI
ncbi:MAG: 50S ribosomal protein L2, partial [Victivallales bacterium]|nr:50S ribosomal protein L2 [Victivallales bacterium]